MLWSDSMHLTKTKYFIHGPLNYGSHNDIIQSNSHVALIHWEFFLYFCTRLGIVSPTLFTSTVSKFSPKKRNKQFPRSYLYFHVKLH